MGLMIAQDPVPPQPTEDGVGGVVQVCGTGVIAVRRIQRLPSGWQARAGCPTVGATLVVAPALAGQAVAAATLPSHGMGP